MKKTILTFMAALAIVTFLAKANFQPLPAQTTPPAASTPTGTTDVLSTLSSSDNASSYQTMAVAFTCSKPDGYIKRGRSLYHFCAE